MMFSTGAMSAVSAALLLCLLPGGLPAPLTCKELLRPVNPLDLQHIEGRRAMVAGSLSHAPLMERLAQRDTASATFSNTSSSDNIIFSRSIRLADECRYISYNISLEGSSFSLNNGNITTTFIHTSCHDCVLLSFDVESGKRQHFYLFSRRRQLEQQEMEEFRAQVECLNMPPPAVMKPLKELCPEQPSTKTTRD